MYSRFQTARIQECGHHADIHGAGYGHTNPRLRILAYELNAHPVDQKKPCSPPWTPHIGGGIPYYVLQAATAAILVLAAIRLLPTFLALPVYWRQTDSFRGSLRVEATAGVLQWSPDSCVIGFSSDHDLQGNEQQCCRFMRWAFLISFTLSKQECVHWKRLRQADEAKRRIKEEEEIHVLRQPIQALPAMKPNDCKHRA